MALACASPARAQLGIIASPGQLSKAHASLEGVGSCQKCHEPGHQVTASKCLPCHKAIAERIRLKFGVHRAVTDTCATCHVEHKGAEADLRRLDPKAFDHATTGFALDGLHAKLSTKCSSCHKQRSFLDLRQACSACHRDVHKGTLGSECTRCHSASVPFKQARSQFDHQRARFVLTGAHRPLACEKCHAGGVFRGLQFDACSGCHKPPHRNTLGPTCTSCHVTDHWATRTIDHARTGFALVGLHARVACERCHAAGIVKPLAFDRCSSCHVNVHHESVKDDCRQCHTEDGFRGGTFDHAARTAFPLVGKHEGLACRKCHQGIATEGLPLASKVVDFGGASRECASCHKDKHGGEYGRTCDACHRPLTFKTDGFRHPRMPEFYLGRHAGVPCVKCHVRAQGPPPGVTARAGALAKATPPSTTCSTCHSDAHLGQVGAECERCHAVDAARFGASRFSHQTASFRLSGRHASLACVECHPKETGTFPSGTGTAMRLKPRSNECRACHKDPHLGQVDQACATCHLTTTFSMPGYEHRGLEALFSVASHSRLPCRSCHKKQTAQFPAGPGAAIRLKGLGKTCLECHP